MLRLHGIVGAVAAEDVLTALDATVADVSYLRDSEVGKRRVAGVVMSYAMSVAEREQFVGQVHVGVLSVAVGAISMWRTTRTRTASLPCSGSSRSAG